MYFLSLQSNLSLESRNHISFSHMFNHLIAQRLRICLPKQDGGSILSLEDPREKKMATCSSILSWEIPWTEEAGRLQSTGLQRVGYN